MRRLCSLLLLAGCLVAPASFRPGLAVAATRAAAPTTATAAAASPGAISTPAAVPADAAAAAQLLALTNAARTSAALPALRESAALTQLAEWRSQDMATRGYFSHDIPPRLAGVCPSPSDRVFCYMDRQHIQYSLAGENIGWHTTDPTDTQQIQEMFLASPEHRANILDASWNAMGVGVYQANDGRTYYTVLFMDGAPPRTVVRPAGRLTARTPSRSVTLRVASGTLAVQLHRVTGSAPLSIAVESLSTRRIVAHGAWDGTHAGLRARLAAGRYEVILRRAGDSGAAAYRAVIVAP